jgi:hypothetical protein
LYEYLSNDSLVQYNVTKQEFDTRILWISVWSETSLGQNDFLGEIHIPLANCMLDHAEEYQLLAQVKKNDVNTCVHCRMIMSMRYYISMIVIAES